MPNCDDDLVIFIVLIIYDYFAGSIPQFIGGELFKQGPRPPAMSIAGLLNWLCNFLVGISFPSIAVSHLFILIISHSGGSRIPAGRGANLAEGAPTPNTAAFRKLHLEMKELGC